MGAIAYCYSRCSSARQQYEKGDSLDRQLREARAYAKEHGYDLREDNILAEIKPAGKGKNLEEGVLREFAKKAVAGGLKGCVLILEDLDRFSRTDPSKATESFLQIINNGVTVVALTTPPSVYDAKAMNLNSASFFQMLNEFFRSNGEVRRKRDWAVKRWGKNKKECLTRKFGMKLPPWLKFVAKKRKGKVVEDAATPPRYEVNEDAAEVIRDLFRRFNSGTSLYMLVKELNHPETGKPTFSGGAWSSSLVKHYLTYRVVLGEYQPRRLEDGKRVNDGPVVKEFFPRIISDEDFAAAKKRFHPMAVRRGRPARDMSKEILFGLLRCPYCGGTLGVQESAVPNRLACNKAYDNACVRVGIYRHFVEWAVAASTEEIYDSITTSQEDASKIHALDVRLHDIREQKKRLVKLVMMGVAEAEAATEDLQLKDEVLAAEIAAFQKATDLANEKDGVAFLDAFVANKMTREIRLKAMEHIRRVVEKVEPHFLGDRQTYEKYRLALIEAERKGQDRQTVWLKLRKEMGIEAKQFVKVTLCRIPGRPSEVVFTRAQYEEQMLIAGFRIVRGVPVKISDDTQTAESSGA